MNIFPVFYHDYILAGVWEFNVLHVTGLVAKDCDNVIYNILGGEQQPQHLSLENYQYFAMFLSEKIIKFNQTR